MGDLFRELLLFCEDAIGGIEEAVEVHEVQSGCCEGVWHGRARVYRDWWLRNGGFKHDGVKEAHSEHSSSRGVLRQSSRLGRVGAKCLLQLPCRSLPLAQHDARPVAHDAAKHRSVHYISFDGCSASHVHLVYLGRWNTALVTSLCVVGSGCITSLNNHMLLKLDNIYIEGLSCEKEPLH